jgi:hypothetical protein
MGGKFQNKIDRLLSRAFKAEAEALELGKENQELHDLLLRYEQLTSRYRMELRKAKDHK